MKSMSIGEVASATGISVQTLRYYERERLLPSPPRRPSGYRIYQPETIQRLGFIRRAKELGFSLDEIRELLSLQDEQPGDRARVKTLADAKREQLNAKIRDLRRMEQALDHLAQQCSGKGPIQGCPIIETLQGERQPQPDTAPS